VPKSGAKVKSLGDSMAVVVMSVGCSSAGVDRSTRLDQEYLMLSRIVAVPVERSAAAAVAVAAGLNKNAVRKDEDSQDFQSCRNNLLFRNPGLHASCFQHVAPKDDSKLGVVNVALELQNPAGRNQKNSVQVSLYVAYSMYPRRLCSSMEPVLVPI
jgi:hypothetical protein